MKTPDEIKKGLECCGTKWSGLSSCAECPYGPNRVECGDGMHDDALALIQQLEAQVPRWIPVEERMPLPHEDVAIIIRQGGYTYLRVGWYGCACQWMQAGLGMIEGEVTHWLPLPESPKEE